MSFEKIIDEKYFLPNTDIGFYELDDSDESLLKLKNELFSDKNIAKTKKYTIRKKYTETIVNIKRIHDFILNSTVKIHPAFEHDAVTNGWDVEILYNNETVYKKIDIFDSSTIIDFIIPITLLPFTSICLKVTFYSEADNVSYYLTQNCITLEKTKLKGLTNEIDIKSDGGFLGPIVQKLKEGKCANILIEDSTDFKRFNIKDTFFNSLVTHKMTENVKGNKRYTIKRGFGTYDVVKGINIKISPKYKNSAIKNGWSLKILFNKLVVYSSDVLYTDKFNLETCLLIANMIFTNSEIVVEINNCKINDEDVLYKLKTVGGFLSKAILNKFDQLNIEYDQQTYNDKKKSIIVFSRGIGGLGGVLIE